MPIPGRGHKSYMQIGRQTGFGSPATATERYEVISMDVHPEQATILDPSLNDQASRRAFFPGGVLYRGNFVIRMNYSGLEELFRGVMGGYNFAGGVPNEHEFTELAALTPYTLELIEGKPQDANICSLVSDALFTSMTIRGNSPDGMLQADIGIIAANKLAGQTPTAALTAPTPAAVLPHHATAIDVGNGDAPTDVRVRSFEVALNQPHTEDRFYLGSVNMDSPLRSDFLTARWNITLEYVTDTIFNALVAGTAATPKLLFVSGSTEFELRSESGIYVEEAHPVAGYGVVLLNCAIETYNPGNPDNSALTVVTRNAEPTLT